MKCQLSPGHDGAKDGNHWANGTPFGPAYRYEDGKVYVAPSFGVKVERKLVARFYEATPEFRAIDAHSAVAFEDDSGLVATTGPRDDMAAWAYAHLFAAAPEMLKEHRRVCGSVSVLLAALSSGRASDPEFRLTLQQIRDCAKALVDLAEGRSDG